MAIATVVNVKGEVFAVNKDGVKRRLQNGDKLQEGEVLVTAPGSSAELDMGGGKIVNVAEQQTFAVDGDVGGPAQPNAASSALESAAAAQKVIQALASGDVNALLEAEAAAAGLAGGGANDGGSSFVQLLRISESVTGVGYQFGSFSQGFVDQPTPGAIEEIKTTTTNPPTILVGDGELFAESAVAKAFEPALPGGSTEGNQSNLVQGQFLVSDPDGVASLVSVTINGMVILMADLVGSVIPGASGMLTITGFDPTTGIATFEYELTAVTTDVPDVDETDVFTFTTTDGTLVSNTATITITIVDDVPTAVNDTNSITEDAFGESEEVTVSGNVLTNDTLGADKPVPVTLNGSPVGTYGTLVLNADGSYTYTLNNDDPAVQALDDGEELSDVFSYTLTDADGDSSVATLTITINGTNDVPTITTDSGDPQGANDVVFEAGLSTGSSAASNSEFAIGTFTVSDADGLDDIFSVTINGDTVLIGDLVGHPFSGAHGTLTVTDYTAGVATYTYELTSATTDGEGVEADVFTLTVSDGTANSAPAMITIEIVDDVPTANDDADGVTEGLGNQATGNVMTGDGTTGGTSGAGVDVQGADGAVVSAVVGFDGSQDLDGSDGFAVTGQYGTLTMNTSGQYTYTLTAASVPEGAMDVFTYTLQDGDNDTDPATLTINIAQDLRVPVVADSGVTVDEEGLPVRGSEPAGTSAAGSSETATTSFFIDTQNEALASLTIGGQTYDLVAGGAQTLVDNAQGTLLINSVTFGSGGYTVDYTYTLKDNVLTHGTQGNTDTVTGPTFAVVATDMTGDSNSTGSITVTISDDAPVINFISNLSAPNVAGHYFGTWDGAIGADGYNAVAGPGDTDINSAEGINVTLLNTSPVSSLIASSSREDIFDGGNYLGEMYTAKLTGGATFFTLFVKADGTYDFNLVTPNPSTTTTETLNLQGSVGGNSDSLYAEQIASAKGFADPQTDIKFTAHTGFVSDANLGTVTSVNTNNNGIGVGSSAGGLRITNGESLTLNFLVGDADTSGSTHPLDTAVRPVDSVKLTFDVDSNNGPGAGNDTATVKFILHLVGGGTVTLTDQEIANGGSFTVADPGGAKILSVDVVNVDGDGEKIFVSGAETKITTTTLPEDLALNFQVQTVDGDGDMAASTLSITIDTNNQALSTTGSDILYGETGVADTFKWGAADANPVSPSVDHVVGFLTDAGDKLDLKDLLEGLNATSEPLENYLHFTSDGTNTTIEVKSQGNVGAGSGVVDQYIVLDGVGDLTNGGANTDATIIANLSTKLVVD